MKKSSLVSQCTSIFIFYKCHVNGESKTKRPLSHKRYKSSGHPHGIVKVGQAMTWKMLISRQQTNKRIAIVATCYELTNGVTICD